MHKQIKLILGVVTVSTIAAVAILILSGEPKEKSIGLNSSDTLVPSVTTSVNPSESSDPILVTIDGKDYTAKEVFGEQLIRFHEMKQREYDFKYANFRKFLADHFISLKAKEKGVTKEEYIKKHIAKGKDLKATEQEVDAFIKEKRIPPDQLANPQVKDQIKEYLNFQKQQGLIEKEVSLWSKTHKIELKFSPPVLKMEVPVGTSPIQGESNAPVTIVAFTDFECPYCNMAHSTVLSLMKKYKGKVKLVHKNFPLPSHENARVLAKVSLCAYQQNPESFWKIYDNFFKKQQELMEQPNLIEDYIFKSGVKPDPFRDCMQSDNTPDKIIEEDMQLGQKLGVSATPTFFVNGRVVQGAMPLDQFEKIIEEALSEVQK